MKKVFALLITGMFTINMQAQFFAGWVYDQETNKPIENAEIQMLPSNIGTTTNAKGVFTFENLKYIRYGVLLKHINYHTDTVIVEITRGLVKREIPLKRIKHHELQEVVIKDSTEVALPYMHNRITSDEIIHEINRDAGEYIKTIPNVSGIKKGGIAIDPVVRGFKFSQLNTFIDGGIKIEGGCPNRMDPALSHVEPDDIIQMEIIKGPHALRYGPSFGGIIKIKTSHQKPYQDWEIHATAKRGYESNWDGHSEYANINGGNPFVFFNIAAARKDYYNYTSGNDLLFKTAFKKYGYSAELGVQPWEGHLMSFSYNESFGRNVYYPALPMDEKSDDTKIMSADYVIQDISKKFKQLSLNSYYTDVNHLMVNHYRPISDTIMANSYIEARNMGYRAEAEFVFNKNEKIYVGTDLEAITKDGEREKTKIKEPNTPQFHDNLWKESLIENYGLFAEYQTKLLELDWVFSFRLDHNMAHSEDTLKIYNQLTEEFIFNKTDSEFANFSASIGFTKELPENFNIQFAIGKGTRSPNMLERFIKVLPIGYDNYDYLGNPELNPETNYQADLTFNFHNDKHGKITLNGFYSMVDDYIKSEALPPSVITPLSPGVKGVKQFINASDWAIFKGFEITYNSAPAEKLRKKISISYTHATDLQAYDIDNKEYIKDAIPEIPPMEIYGELAYALFSEKLIPKVALKYAFAQKHVAQAFYESETPHFYVMDISLQYKHNKNLVFNAGTKNIFDEAYYEHLNRNIIGSMNPFYEPGRSFFINAIFKL